MVRLGVNVDHVATIRQARRGKEPDPVWAAAIAELAGADGIVVHLREDRRHIQERDLRILRSTVRTRLNLEMAATEEMKRISLEVKPDKITIVPERREEITTEGGINARSMIPFLKTYIKEFKENGIGVCLFIDPDLQQVDASKEIGADMVEINTGRYSEAWERGEEEGEAEKLEAAVIRAKQIGLEVAAGHGLNYWNIKRLLRIKDIEEYNIGHSIVARAIFVGFHMAVKEMVQIIKEGER